MKNLLLILMLTLSLTGCVKPHVGKHASMSSPAVCPTPSFPAECRIECYSHLIPEAIITKLDDNGNYFIKGSFDPTEGDFKSFSHVRSESTFRILFIHNSKVFDSKQINVIHTDLARKLPFELNYNSKGTPIDAVAFSYKLHVSG